jgi:hypothetical protein
MSAVTLENQNLGRARLFYAYRLYRPVAGKHKSC